MHTAVVARDSQAAINGEVVGNFASYSGSTFNALGLEADGVHNLTLATVGLTENEWISFMEVSDAYRYPADGVDRAFACHTLPPSESVKRSFNNTHRRKILSCY